MAVTLLDTSAVIAFLYRDDRLHRSATTAVLSAGRRGGLAVSVVTVAELLTGVERGHHSAETVEEFLRAGAPTHHPVDDRIARAAARLRGSKSSLQMPDALIVATAEVASDIDAVVTGDARWAGSPGLGVTVELLRG